MLFHNRYYVQENQSQHSELKVHYSMCITFMFIITGDEPSDPSPTLANQSQALITMDAVEIREREAEELQDLEK